jgi:hypothetical protein
MTDSRFSKRAVQLLDDLGEAKEFLIAERRGKIGVGIFPKRKESWQRSMDASFRRRIPAVKDIMKIINCFVLSVSLVIAGCGDFEWFPENTSVKQPGLTKAFGVPTAVIGTPVTLTFTITNAAGNPAQSGLGFTDTFPAGTQNTTIGMVVANPPNESSSCGGNIHAGGTTNPVAAEDTAITFSGGAIGAGPATCTISVQVTSNAATTNLNQSFINGPANISNMTNNLNNNMSNQSLAFSPVTQAVGNGTLSARDLVVNPNGNPQFSLFIDNNGNGATATVTLTGKGPTGAAVTTVTVPATPVFVPSLAVRQQLTLTGVTVDPTVKSWQISSIQVTQ